VPGNALRDATRRGEHVGTVFVDHQAHVHQAHVGRLHGRLGWVELGPWPGSPHREGRHLIGIRCIEQARERIGLGIHVIPGIADRDPGRTSLRKQVIGQCGLLGDAPWFVNDDDGLGEVSSRRFTSHPASCRLSVPSVSHISLQHPHEE
jgi:hypothetical protein